MNAQYNKFKSAYESLIRSESAHNIFDGFLEFALLCFKAERNDEENKKMNTLSDTYLKIFIAWGDASEDNEDPLGDLFMEFLSYGKNGQFFTPMSICIMMQEMTMGNDQSEISMCDPACGSGRTLISAGMRNRNMWVYGSDIDHRCVKMTALNMLIHSCRGEVAWMNTLSMDHWGSYHISRHNIGGMFLSAWHQTGPGQTNFIERLKSAQEKQKQEVPAKELDEKGQLILF